MQKVVFSVNERINAFTLNQVDDVPFPDFTFVKESFEIYNGNNKLEYFKIWGMLR